MKKFSSVKGFSLISFMVYLTICVSVILLSTQVFMRLTTCFVAYSSKVQQLVDAHLMLDTIARDLYYAPQDINSWQTFKPNHVAYKNNNVLISWHTKKCALIRMVKKFDTAQHHWKRGRSTKLLPCSAHLLFTKRKLNECKDDITIQLTYHNCTITRSVVPRGK